MKKALVLCFMILLLTTFIFSACATPEPTVAPTSTSPVATTPQVINLIFSTAHMRMEPPAEYANYFMDLVEKNSNGRVKFERHFDGLMGTALEHAKLLGTGSVDFGHTYFEAEKTPLHQYNNFIMGSSKVALDMQTQLIKTNAQTAAILEKELADNGVKLLNSAPSGPGGIIGRIQFSSFADLKGKKMGVLFPMKEFETFGITTVVLDIPDVYESLSRGVIDVIAMAVDPMVGLKWHEVSKCFMSDNTFSPGRGIFVNLNTWNKLPEDIQKIVQDAAQQMSDFGTQRNEEVYQANLKIFKDAGLTVGTLPASDVEKIFKLQYDSTNARMLGICEKQGKGADAKIILQALDKIVWGK